ncbi:hypothetical protein MYX65_01590 [Acidobacteria bacterium AH-259-L09]|nr:hypothetical protein [Acidobacteria bacterium AH-259-L09]
MSNGLASKLFLDLTAELLSRGTSVCFRPSGRSMYPSIQEGELITVEPVQPPDVKREDIILYRSERGVIAHRVVEVSGSQAEPSAYGAAGFSLRASSSNSQEETLVLRLRGDASLCCDEPVAGQQVLGRVVGVQRNGRSIQLASRGAKVWHKARRLASRLKGRICGGGIGSQSDLDFFAKALNRCSRSTPFNQRICKSDPAKAHKLVRIPRSNRGVDVAPARKSSA